MARVLGLDIKVPNDKRWFPKDEFLLSDKWRKWHYGLSDSKDKDVNQYQTLEDLSETRSYGHYFEGLFAKLFTLEAFIALSLVPVIWLSRLCMILGR